MKTLIYVGIVAGAAASVPMIYQSNLEYFDSLVAPPKAEMTVASVEPAAPRAAPSSASGRRVEIASGSRGHFQTEFRLNGKPVEAMIDTGATVVAINRETARRIGFNLQSSDFNFEVSTANGKARAAALILPVVEVGRIRVERVQAVVLEDDALRSTLIGMSFLDRLERYSVEGRTLILQQ